MEPGETGVETLSEAEGRAEVVIESEPSVGSQTLFEQREGKWIGNVEGSEMELTMQDEQILASVLALELGDPIITNHAEGFNFAGEPVTWTAIYERTDSGIMTTHIEEPRDTPLMGELEDDYVVTAPVASTATRPATLFDSSEHGPAIASRESSNPGQLWFERGSGAEEDIVEGSETGNVIDFFSKGRFFETDTIEDSEQSAGLFQPEAPAVQKDEGSPEANSNVIEAIFRQVDLTDSLEEDDETANAEGAEAQAPNNVVELFVGSIEVAGTDSVGDTEEIIEADEEAIEAGATDTAEIPVLSAEIAEVVDTKDSDAVVQEVESPAITVAEAKVDQVLVSENEVADAAIEAVHEDAVEEESVTLEIPPTDKVTPVLAELAEAPIESQEAVIDNIGVVEALEITEDEEDAQLAGSRVESAVVLEQLETGSDNLVELDLDAEVVPASNEQAEPGVITQEVEPEVVTPEPDLITADLLEPTSVERPDSPVIEELIEAIDVKESSDVIPSPKRIANEPTLDQAFVASDNFAPRAELHPEFPTEVTDESENVVRLETSEPDLDLSATDWASEFGAQPVEVFEPEPAVVSKPKREVRISRHESGMLDITVTFESEDEVEQQVKTKKAQTARTMRRAA